MHYSKPFQFNQVETKKIEKVKLIEVIEVNETQNKTKYQDGNTGWEGVILAPISFILVCAAIGYIVLYLCRNMDSKGSKVDIKCCQQYPCINCRFSHNNDYLKCAVHPSNVFTKQALNCPDYNPM